MQRRFRVGETIRRALTEILHKGGLHDPTPERFGATISEVRITQDLRCATAYVLTLGGHQQEKVVEILNAEVGRLKRQLGRRIRLRYMPELRFQSDISLERAHRIEYLLRQKK